MAKPTKKPEAEKATKAPAKTSHKEVNYVLTPEDIEQHNLVGVKIHRAFINDKGELYIKNFGTDLVDINLGKKKSSDQHEPGTYHNI